MTALDQPSEHRTAPAPSLNRRLKSWPGWLVMLFVVIVFLVVGATRTSGPLSQEDRVDDLTRRIACPVCDGESVFVSQNNASRAIRNQVADLVRANELSDDAILAVVDNRSQAELLLVPRSSGLDALVWVLPAVGLVVGATGLALAFRRWKLEAAAVGDPTVEDRALVEAALDDIDDEPTADVWPDPGRVATNAAGGEATTDDDGEVAEPGDVGDDDDGEADDDDDDADSDARSAEA